MKITKSTMKPSGPRTAAGKSRSSRNALKHGLSRSYSHLNRLDRIATLADKFAGGFKGLSIHAAATKAAKARAFLEEISSIRRVLIAEATQRAHLVGYVCHGEARAVAFREVSADLKKLLRYQRRAYGEWRKAKAALDVLTPYANAVLAD